MIRTLLITVLLALMSCSLQADWKTYSYQVVNIVDGDTIDVTDGNVVFRVRMAGIDAPEQEQPYSKAATKLLQQLIANKKIQIEPVSTGMGFYKRTLGQVYVNGKDVGVELVAAGLATYYRPRCRDYPKDKKRYNYDPVAYVTAEQHARDAKRGMWSRAPVEMPCTYKHKNR